MKLSSISKLVPKIWLNCTSSKITVFTKKIIKLGSSLKYEFFRRSKNLEDTKIGTAIALSSNINPGEIIKEFEKVMIDIFF